MATKKSRAGSSRGKPPAKRSSRSRRGKSEAMTGKKAAAVEVRTVAAGIGDNSGLGLGEPVTLDEKDVKSLVKATKAAMEKKDTAVSLLRGVNKMAAELHPDLPGAIKQAISEERKSDPAKLKAKLEVLGITLKASGSTVQLSVFDTLAGDVQEQAYQRGLGDAKCGRSSSNPYPENSDLADQYAKGFRHGTADNMNVSRDDADAAEAERVAQLHDNGMVTEGASLN